MDIQQYISSGIIEAYVMGLCSADEEKELERLRLEYPELDKAIFAYEEQMEKNMLRQTTLPRADVDEHILTVLDNLNKTASPVIPLKSKKRYWLAVSAVAAGVLLAISAGFNYYLYQEKKKIEARVGGTASLPPGDYEIMKDPTITPVAMYGVASHAICRCTMFWDKKTGKVYIMIHHLPLSSDKKDYQLWATVNGQPVNVGIVKDEIRGRFIELNNVPPGATAFIITLENAGGSTIPTEEETYVRGFI
jgi:anti-sigma-K factor RskA